jgi:hypothetical protein
MSGIEREITLDTRHVAKHLPDTPQVQRLLRRGRAAHIFKNAATMERVAQAIIARGEFTGGIRGYELTACFLPKPLVIASALKMAQTLRYFMER